MTQREPRVRSIKRERIRYFSQKYLPNFVGGNVRERERGREKGNPNFSFRLSEFRRSEVVEPRTKVHHLDKGYV